MFLTHTDMVHQTLKISLLLDSQKQQEVLLTRYLIGACTHYLDP